ncbi:MAG TPA: delta-60 repeat domain-containing protein, partial [Vicinamibacteria bacterium]|nr:delta-60 repeat domain-containing protein [Vicinamibacteria bacterium]
MGRTRRTAFVLFALAISTASVRAGYAPGCTVALEILGAVAHEANAVTIQPDGKIVVAGYADLGLGAGRDFLVARFHPDLSLDTSFNGTGYRVDDFPYVRDDEAFAVVVQFDQKIVVGGYTKQTPAKHYFAFARYTRDGSLDASFGAGGFRAIDFPSSSSDQLRGMAIQPDGKILGAGFSTPGGTQRLVVVRLLKDGSLDTSFDGNGTA